VFRRFRRWSKRGVWQRVFEILKDPNLNALMFDSTIIRAHQHAAGAKKGETRKKPWAVRAADLAPNCTRPSRSKVALSN